MQFTREPTVESILYARDGFRLSIKNTKYGSQEPIFVESIQLVSFGGQLFYRHQDRPKAFLLPAQDYEVMEVRETKLALKSPTPEKTIKISGGKERSEEKAAPRMHDPLDEIDNLEAPAELKGSVAEDVESQEQAKEKGRRSRRSRRRRGGGGGGGNAPFTPTTSSEKGALIPPPELAAFPEHLADSDEMVILPMDDEIVLSSENEIDYDSQPTVVEKPVQIVRPFSLPSLEEPPPLVRELYSYRQSTDSLIKTSEGTPEEEV